MKRDELITLISRTAADFLGKSHDPAGVPIDEATRLFGKDGLLDSLGLVNLLMDIEQAVNDRTGLTIALADDRAMSQTRSPFRTIGTLADYIGMLTNEQSAA
jgi:acyl carrier protein